jgi:hypothetical protein
MKYPDDDWRNFVYPNNPFLAVDKEWKTLISRLIYILKNRPSPTIAGDER